MNANQRYDRNEFKRDTTKEINLAEKEQFEKNEKIRIEQETKQAYLNRIWDQHEQKKQDIQNYDQQTIDELTANQISQYEQEEQTPQQFSSAQAFGLKKHQDRFEKKKRTQKKLKKRLMHLPTQTQNEIRVYETELNNNGQFTDLVVQNQIKQDQELAQSHFDQQYGTALDQLEYEIDQANKEHAYAVKSGNKRLEKKRTWQKKKLTQLCRKLEHDLLDQKGFEKLSPKKKKQMIDLLHEKAIEINNQLDNKPSKYQTSKKQTPKYTNRPQTRKPKFGYSRKNLITQGGLEQTLPSGTIPGKVNLMILTYK